MKWVIVIVITTLSTKLPWPGKGEGTFRSSSQAATRPLVYTTHGGGFTLSLLMLNMKAGKL